MPAIRMPGSLDTCNRSTLKSRTHSTSSPCVSLLLIIYNNLQLERFGGLQSGCTIFKIKSLVEISEKLSPCVPRRSKKFASVAAFSEIVAGFGDTLHFCGLHATSSVCLHFWFSVTAKLSAWVKPYNFECSNFRCNQID